MNTRNGRINYLIVGAVLVMAFLMPILAQEKPPVPVPVKPPQPPAVLEERSAYRLQTHINEVEAGKVINSRSYQMVIEDNATGTVKVTREIPVQLGQGSIQYRAVGLTLSCRITERKEHLLVIVRFSLNDVVVSDSTGNTSTIPAQPVIRGYDSDLSAALKPGVPTVIATMDSMTGKSRYELEMTATKLH